MKKLIPFLLALSLVGSYAQASMLDLKILNSKTYVVFKPQSLKNLYLGLNNSNGQVLGGFIAWQKQLPNCQNLSFAMNAGMYHPNYQPVGLYIENSKQMMPLNVSEGTGNFFMQPNGVVAWNQHKAIILKTKDWGHANFKAMYATQSGPMLVVDGKIMSQFLKDSDSKKIRNGVGIKDGQLYFVVSQQRVNFYEFAQFFKEGLQVEQALYLDGSISSIYAPTINRYDRAFKLGPMVGYIEQKPSC